MSFLGDGTSLSHLIVVLAFVLLFGAIELARRAARDARIASRLFADAAEPISADEEATAPREGSALARWLSRAGHRSSRAEKTFISLSTAALLLAAGSVTARLGEPVPSPLVTFERRGRGVESRSQSCASRHHSMRCPRQRPSTLVHYEPSLPGFQIGPPGREVLPPSSKISAFYSRRPK